MAVRNPVVVHFRVSEEEAAMLDEWRGTLKRAEFLRLLFIQERRRRAKQT